MEKNILFFTGWGATCSVWEGIIPALDQGYQINCITPSWAGNNSYGSLSDIDAYVENVAKTIQSRVNIISWSMGGLIAIKLASRYPDLVSSICFVSSVPNFVSDDNTKSGIDKKWFTQFELNFVNEPIATMKRFYVLQTMNDEFAKETIKRVRRYCDPKQYDFNECRYGLELLKFNLTDEFANLECKTAFIHGDVDAVVNIQAARDAARSTQSEFYVVKHAGHVPHVSHAAQVCEIINSNL